MVKKENSNVTNKSESLSAGCGVEMAGIKCVKKELLSEQGAFYAQAVVPLRTVTLLSLRVKAALCVWEVWGE